MLLRRFQYPNTPGLIIRRTFPELYRSHIVKLFEEYPGLRSLWREQSKELIFPNGSRLFFGSAEHAGDMSAFYSTEFADIMVDEAQEFSQSELEGLTGSNRCTSNSEITPAMLFTFMPGISETGLPPKGLGYLKRVLVDGDLRGEEKRNKWGFVPVFAWDNIEWLRKELGWIKDETNEWRMGPDAVSEQEFYSWSHEVRRQFFIDRAEFGATLSSLTNKSLRDAWLEGKWDKFQGQYFLNFDYDVHTCEPQDIKLRSWTRYWVSGDWGGYHPACFHLHAEDDRGCVATIAELWEVQTPEFELGRKIGAMCAGKKIEAFPFSWDAFGKLNKTVQRPITELIAEGLPDHFPYPNPADSSPGSRISGWRYMSHMLDTKKWIISRDCPKLIECIPSLMRDMERNTEDVLKVDFSENTLGDDPADSARYGLQYMVQAPSRPLDVRIQDRIEAYAEKRGTAVERLEPNTIAMLSRKAERLERSKGHHTVQRWRPGMRRG